MGLLGEAEFLEALRRLYEDSRNKDSGSVWVTFKRTFPEVGGSRGAKRRRKLESCEEKPEATPVGGSRGAKRRRKLESCEEKPEATPVCLVRATDGKKKISVQVQGERASAFSQQLMAVSRLYIDKVKPISPAAAKEKQQKKNQGKPKQQQQRKQSQKKKSKKHEKSNSLFKREM
ncbi:signal recognition particle 14 kDa protein, putative [Eimeria praecox]|uniref:Signal recognition particle 14 kDa protein n=1 Tax=Eimeria praecox TaxID=51316 RepID=U6H5U2_9EIME|nr:signal recognition particle 14 kDa protein, putative [Eimeria praecox]